MMQNKIKEQPPVVLTIAGSDSLSGGGLQADLATFNEYNLFGLTAITSIVTVLPEIFEIHAESAKLLADQLASVQAHFTLAGIKLGLIPNLEQMIVILQFLNQLDRNIPLVVDPVLVFKEDHAPELDAIKKVYLENVFPLATIITPNLVESELLTNQPIKTLDDLIQSAQILKQTGAKNVIVKGGRRLGKQEAVDVLIMENNELEILSNPIIQNNFNNGAGCTFSAAILSGLVQNATVLSATQQAKTFVQHGIENGIAINQNLGNVWQGANRDV
ncbi:phosphomethylpyrimidine kinase [Weissella koreensis KACC 15510]|uniref:bifunctional hydroxymethylpyrimidine kinase/phosphomethylpyrimidine kinase n=1 Tax=Weissella koreensis TaxID=165096 RepID=UPI0002175896|nr:bifunctional hydroxymethylpyrimidine kinase/phosphomethylpyrimidine kinase [Weissella koreensis]AEJ22951.1 phosphomethylpyrimidine kinase [Weissella koreensis KACC 15510]